MGRTDRTPWRVQWHVAADGTVIRERARGDQPHQQLFQTFATTRPVTVAELDELSVRAAHEMRRIDRFSILWWTGLATFLAVVSLLGGLLTRSVSGTLLPGLGIGAVVALALVSPVFRLVAMLLPRDGGGSAERVWQEAGLASSAGVTMDSGTARRMVEAPGSTSGTESWAARA